MEGTFVYPSILYYKCVNIQIRFSLFIIYLTGVTNNTYPVNAMATTRNLIQIEKILFLILDLRSIDGTAYTAAIVNDSIYPHCMWPRGHSQPQ